MIKLNDFEALVAVEVRAASHPALYANKHERESLKVALRGKTLDEAALILEDFEGRRDNGGMQ